MSILSPETLFKMLGVDPALVEQVGKTLVGGMAELEGMKQGFGNAMNHFSGRLNALETRLENIETLLLELRNVRNNITIPTFAISHASDTPDNAGAAALGNGGINGYGGNGTESRGGEKRDTSAE
jgi:hypothetical protein